MFKRTSALFESNKQRLDSHQHRCEPRLFSLRSFKLQIYHNVFSSLQIELQFCSLYESITLHFLLLILPFLHVVILSPKSSIYNYWRRMSRLLTFSYWNNCASADLCRQYFTQHQWSILQINYTYSNQNFKQMNKQINNTCIKMHSILMHVK